LIEKVRTNLATYSNDFSNGSWNKVTDGTYSLVTENITDAFGNISAVYKVTLLTGSFLVFRKTLASATTQTTNFSVYVKKTNASSYLSIDINDNVDATAAANTNWQRISNTRATASFVDITTYSLNEPFYIFASQIELGDIATDYIPTTTSAVSVGPLANLPRLNYGADGCPSLLLEPQRTNLALYSEQFDNAAWTTTGVTVTANNTQSPDGYQNADKVTNATTSDFISQIIAGPTATDYAASFYIKNEDATLTEILVRNSVSSLFGEINWSGSQLVSITGVVNGTLTFEAVGNDWYRIFANYTSVETVQRVRVRPDTITSGKSIYLWGYQLEQGASYATSYIPTLSTSVTRLADSASKTGISSLIGTEGTIFFEVNDFSYNPQAVLFKITGLISSQTRTTNQIRFEGVGYDYFYTPTQKHLKIAAAYTASTIVIYINGTQVHEDTSVTITGGSNLLFNESGNGIEVLAQALVFKTRLTNADLARLTSL
jgi:hypothetical protein